MTLVEGLVRQHGRNAVAVLFRRDFRMRLLLLSNLYVRLGHARTWTRPAREAARVLYSYREPATMRK